MIHELADLSSSEGTTPYQRSPRWLPHQQSSLGEGSPEEVLVRLHSDEGLADDNKVDDTQHPPARLLLQQKRPLLGKGSQHHLIYVG